jgi:amino acid adenylation domain-containing protein
MVLDDIRSCVAREPDAIAVQDDELRLTYLELARHASGLAAGLIRRGIGPDDVVAVYADRSAELVVAELSVLLAGAAYLPLDPAHPAARTGELLALSGAAAVISTGPLSSDDALRDSDLVIVDLNEVPAGPLAWPVDLADATLAYVIFTSGSTGRPKGVAISHGNLASLIRWRQQAYPMGPRDRAMLMSSPGFDASVWDTWPILAVGGTLVIPPAEVRTSPAALVTWLADEQITSTLQPTPLAEALLDAEWPTSAALRVLHTGGSALMRGVPGGLPFTLVNLYGPTECTVAVTSTPVLAGGPVPPPIGFPVEGVRCYVLDGLDPVPDGEAGEMCLAGACVARGYLGDPATTARSFVPDITVPGQRMYRTGDKVRRGTDGSFEYLGRFDEQVKIRGFRIEPGEVAAVLRQHPAIRESFVAAERSGPADPRLIGYVAAEATSAELIDFAASRLPSYMVPAAIVVLPALPVTPSGKVDRAALPAPDRAAAGLPEAAIAPARTPTERALAAIVAELLGGVQVGAADDFFALGGNSLLVGRLAAEIAAERAVTLSLADVYRAPTVSAIAALIDERAGHGAAAPGMRLDSPPPMPSGLPVRHGPRDRPVPLSLQQRRVWFFEQLAPGNLAYTTQASLSLRGQVDTSALRAALDEIVRRHEVLRTAFVTVDGVAMQQLVAGVTAPLRVLDVPAEQAEELIAAELRKPFDLTRPPLARWVLFRHGDGANTLVYAEHHIVHDGWSQGVLLSELSVLYQAFAAGEPSPLPEPAAQYADYALWQREWMQGEVLKAHVDHGVAGLAGAPHVLELPADHRRPMVKSFRGAVRRMEVPAELSRALRSFSQQHRGSLFATMYAGFAALLYRYTGQEDMLVGTGAANRSLPELQQVLGMIVNTLVLRTKVRGQMSFTDLLEQVQQTVVDTLAWPDTPVDALIDAIGPARDASRTPLFQVIFTFHDSAVPDLNFGGLTGTVTDRENGAAMCDLTVMVVPRSSQRLGREPRPEDDDMSLVWEYSTDLFDEATMTLMAAHYLNLLACALAAPSTQIGDLSLLADPDLAVLDGWSRGPAAVDSYPADATIPALFAAQVVANPDATALAFGSTTISYAELDRRGNALAWYLRRRGVSTDTPVAVAIERGPDLITALLAVLKAGGAYVPVDPASPPARTAAMIAAAGARLVLVTDAAATTMTQLAEVDVVRVDGIDFAEPALAMDGLAAPPDTAHPLSLAYISFTSGSTGVPKGVAVPQRGVMRLTSNPTFASLGPGERLLHLAPVAFDASTLEIWGALLNGATVVVAPPGPLSLSEIAALLRTAGVTVTWLTAGLFDQLAETDLDAIGAVPLVLTGGDALTPDTVRAVLAARHGRPLVNGYGPTENTTFTTCHVMNDPGQVGPTVPIGRPIQHTTVRILDDRGHPVPIGVTGELYTGGDGLARGYAGNAAATARAFVPDPTGHGARLYRTGDLARWRGDGIVEFVGRADDQVKIRGFRVEPGEVAAVLRSHPAVRDAVVIVTGDGAHRHLTGYVTPADGQDPSTLRPTQLRDFLAQRLPDYLIPAGFKSVDRLPLNASGKVDRTALPAPDHDTDGPAAPPRGATEERLAEIWSLLLPQDSPRGEPGREDDFFAFGGDSLLAARLIFRIGEEFGVELGLAAFYQTRTLAACAAAIDAAMSQAAPSTIGRRDRKAYRVAAPRTARQRQEG